MSAAKQHFDRLRDACFLAGDGKRRTFRTSRASCRIRIKLGLVAAMSGQSAKSGEAIVRGLSVAVDEINAKGGVLGKKVELNRPRRREQSG